MKQRKKINHAGKSLFALPVAGLLAAGVGFAAPSYAADPGIHMQGVIGPSDVRTRKVQGVIGPSDVRTRKAQGVIGPSDVRTRKAQGVIGPSDVRAYGVKVRGVVAPTE